MFRFLIICGALYWVWGNIGWIITVCFVIVMLCLWLEQSTRPQPTVSFSLRPVHYPDMPIGYNILVDNYLCADYVSVDELEQYPLR